MLRRAPLVVILGSTGTGKTKLSIEICQKFNGEIISADSMQVYRGLDIVTAKATDAERRAAPHHLLDVATPGEPFTVVHFRDRALRIIDDLLSRNKMPIIVGGTNYYIESLLWKVLIEPQESPFLERDTLIGRKRGYESSQKSPTTDREVSVKQHKQSTSSDTSGKCGNISVTGEHISSDISATGEHISSDISAGDDRIVSAASVSINDPSRHISTTGEHISSDISATGEHISSDISATGEHISSDISAGDDRIVSAASVSINDPSRHISTTGEHISSDISATGEHISSDISATGEHISSDISAGDDRIVSAASVSINDPSRHISTTGEHISSDISATGEHISSDISGSSVSINDPSRQVSATGEHISSDSIHISDSHEDVADDSDLRGHFSGKSELFSENIEHISAGCENIIDQSEFSDELKWESMSGPQLHSMLADVDPCSADRLHPNNKRKIMRALQVLRRSGQPMSTLLAEQRGQPGGCGLGGPLRYPHVVLFWLRCDQSILDARLDQRVDSMMADGLIKELKEFYDLYVKPINDPDYTRGVLQTIGLKEFMPYLEITSNGEDAVDEKTRMKILSECLTSLKIATRRYARKQNRWVLNRFLGHESRQVPLLYALDTSDTCRWSEEVYSSAENIIQSYMEDRTPAVKPLTKCSSTPNATGANLEVTHFCETCKRIFIGDYQYELHKKSKKHQKIVSKKKRELLKNLETPIL